MNAIATTVVRQVEAASDYAIALCADARLFPLACVVARRLAQMAEGAYDVYLFTEPDADFGRVPADGRFGIVLPDIGERLPPAIRRNRFLSITSMRLFVPEILQRYRRILYLDSDIRLEASLAPLFTLDLAGAPIAAVDDYTLPFLPYAKASKNDRIRVRRHAVGHSADEPYFNAGVMLIDADAWRSQQTTAAALALFEQLSALQANDQEMLNVLFRGRWAALSPRWNFTFFHDLGFEEALQPVLYHYAGAKPWELRWDRGPDHLRALAEMIAGTPFADFLKRAPASGEYRRALVKQIKWALRHPGSFPRAADVERCVRDAQAPHMRAVYAAYLIDNTQKGRFIDARQGITSLDENRLRGMLISAGREFHGAAHG